MRIAPDPEFRPSIAVGAWAVSFVVGNIGVLILANAVGWADVDSDRWPLWLVALTFVPLWSALIASLVWVSRTFGSRRFRRDYGLEIRPSDVPIGLLVGVVAQLVFVQFLYELLGVFFDVSSLEDQAKDLTDKASGLGIALLVLLVVFGAPFVEELFFRGLVLKAFNSRINDTVALIVSAVLFALAHFQVLQFPGLVLFGMVAGYLAQRSGRLGPSIFAHMGFNAATVVVLISERR
ncbi:MAG: lysostaphin resistance A-like protein [Acidimicrobiia bacterium]